MLFGRGIWQSNLALKGRAFEHNFGPGWVGGGGFEGANVQKLLNAWGVARGDMLKFRIDQRIKGTTSPKQMRQLLESKLEKFRQTCQV